MGLTVWVDEWQQACCGEHFSVGSVVSWTLTDAPPELAPLFDPASGVVIDGLEDHHSDLAEGAAVTRGTVQSIRAVQLQYARGTGAIPGSAVLTAVSDSGGGSLGRIAAFLVELEVG